MDGSCPRPSYDREKSYGTQGHHECGRLGGARMSKNHIISHNNLNPKPNTNSKPNPNPNLVKRVYSPLKNDTCRPTF